MNLTEKSVKPITVDTKNLMKYLDCGRKTAVEIGTNANARIEVGRRILWNVKLIQQYLDSVAS